MFEDVLDLKITVTHRKSLSRFFSSYLFWFFVFAFRDYKNTLVLCQNICEKNEKNLQKDKKNVFSETFEERGVL